jgi:hypothetical protein
VVVAVVPWLPLVFPPVVCRVVGASYFFQIANVPWMLMIVGHTPRVPRTEGRRFSPIRNTPHVILVTLLSWTLIL